MTALAHLFVLAALPAAPTPTTPPQPPFPTDVAGWRLAQGPELLDKVTIYDYINRFIGIAYN